MSPVYRDSFNGRGRVSRIAALIHLRIWSGRRFNRAPTRNNRATAWAAERMGGAGVSSSHPSNRGGFAKPGTRRRSTFAFERRGRRFGGTNCGVESSQFSEFSFRRFERETKLKGNAAGGARRLAEFRTGTKRARNSRRKIRDSEANESIGTKSEATGGRVTRTEDASSVGGLGGGTGAGAEGRRKTRIGEEKKSGKSESVSARDMPEKRRRIDAHRHRLVGG